jgi:hypothetical protein
VPKTCGLVDLVRDDNFPVSDGPEIGLQLKWHEQSHLAQMKPRFLGKRDFQTTLFECLLLRTLLFLYLVK